MEQKVFEVNDLCGAWKNKSGSKIPVFSNVSFCLKQKGINALCGINGSGKSTLLSVLSGIAPDNLDFAGCVKIDDSNLKDLSVKERARKISFLVQKEENAWDITGRKLVENGRFVYEKWYAGLSKNDVCIVDQVINLLGLNELENKKLSQMSGGEVQRFRIARCLAQETDYIFLDEPLTGLDLNHQKELIDLLKQLCNQGKTVLLSIHDVNLAARCADNLLFLKKDRAGIYTGPAKDLMQPSVIEEVFGNGFQLYSHPVSGVNQIL